MIEGEGCSPEKNLNVQGINGRSQIKSCIGYLDHPFEKEAPWAFTTRLFFEVR